MLHLRLVRRAVRQKECRRRTGDVQQQIRDDAHDDLAAKVDVLVCSIVVESLEAPGWETREILDEERLVTKAAW